MDSASPTEPLTGSRGPFPRAAWLTSWRSDTETLHRLIIAASLLLPLTILAGGGYLIWHATTTAARAELTRSVDLVHENTARVFETYQLLMKTAAMSVGDASDSDITAKEFSLHQQFADVIGHLPQVRDLFVLNADGHPLVSAQGYPVQRAINTADRDYFRLLASRQSDVTVSSLLISRIDKTPTFIVASARRSPDGRFAGSVAVSVRPQYFEDYWVRNGIADETPDGVTIVLFRSDGEFLVRWPQPVRPGEGLHATESFLARIAKNPDRGIYEATSTNDGLRRLITYRRVEGTPFYVVASQRFTGLTSDWLSAIQTHLYFGIPATLALFALSIVAARRDRKVHAALDLLRTEVRRREEVEDALRQTQKMEAIGRLTGGIAHDFNNLLTAIGGSIEYLIKAIPAPDERTRRYSALGHEAVQRATRLTHRLLAFARQQPLTMQTVNLNRLVAGMSELLVRTLGEHIEIESVLAGGLWPTRTDPVQLENCLLNLAVNARDAMPDGGRLTIETANTSLDSAYAAAHPEVQAGQYVMLAVTDTGTGMSPDTIARAFDPFFTTKPTGMGTGLGLSMVYGFAKQSGGHVKIYSELGVGTSIKLYLPRGPAGIEIPLSEQTTPAREPAGGGKTVLVVEDDEAVRNVSVGFLRDLGYEVLAARDAASALQLLHGHPEVAVLFTDVVLPGGTDGRKLAAEASRVYPDLQVLFTTGYTPNAIIHGGILDAGVQLLPKPFTAEALDAKLREVLSAQRAALDTAR
ncbi:MAG TPA: ATP-binding protein [Acetobacteraceae bacterium]